MTALAPDEGQAVGDVFYKDDPRPKVPKLSPDKNGLIWLPEDAFASAFAQHASSEELAVLVAVPRPISPVCITTKVGKPLGKNLPTHYLVAQEDRMIIGKTQASWLSA